MKANHNTCKARADVRVAVAYEQRYNKWKQITTNEVVVNPMANAVAYEQRYNKWKQITTQLQVSVDDKGLLPMSKDTINESKSQRDLAYRHSGAAVAYEQRYNKWKQITTSIV